jgi:hypothetical protein
MREVFLVPPIAALVTGCAEDAALPSPTLPEGAHAPLYATLAFPARDEVFRHWQVPPGSPWAPYAKYTLITALDEDESDSLAFPLVDPLPEVQGSAAAARQVASRGVPPGVMWVVDLRGPASVAFGATLSTAGVDPVTLVPTFNNWPGAGEVVPAEETLAALATISPRPPTDAGAARPVFLLDAWRLAYRHTPIADGAYDNRYALAPSDFPDAEALGAAGIRRVIYVVERRAAAVAEEDDLTATFLGYERAGIAVALVDLDELAHVHPEDDWDELLARDHLTIVPRPTVVLEPEFYARSHGGFGGIRAIPSFGLRRPGGGLGWGIGHASSGFHGGGGGHGGGG